MAEPVSKPSGGAGDLETFFLAQEQRAWQRVRTLKEPEVVWFPTTTVENEVYSNTAAEGDVTVLHGCIANELHCFQSEMKRYSSETVSFLLLIYSLTCSAVSRKDIPQRPRLVQDALDNNKSVYYFGLGSNMSREKLEGRSPDGQLIKIQRMEPAVVPNHRLAFNLKGFPPLEPGMGSLEPVESSNKALLKYKANECHGALVKLSAQNYERVMRSEGVGTGSAQQGYDEVVVTAIPYNRWRKPVQAVALRARSHVRLSQDPCPSRRYMKILRQGAQELGLKEEYQHFLRDHPVQEVSVWLRRIAPPLMVHLIEF